MAQNKNTKTDRKRMVLAMEYVCRQINDEDVFMGWLMNGVPDGDVPYGCFDIATIDDDDTLIEDENFKELMECFLRRMKGAAESGGLYCGDIITSEDETCEYIRNGDSIHPIDHADDTDLKYDLNDTEDNMDLENESDNDDKENQPSIFDRLNDFISDHIEIVLSCVLVFLLIILAIPFVVNAYFSQEKYLETKSDTTLTYTIVDKTMTTSGSGDNICSHYHIVVKNPETGANKAFSCTSGLYTSIVVGESLNIRERVVYNTHYKTTSTEYTANGTNLYG